MRRHRSTRSSCRDTLELVQAYLDEECDPARAWRVARHLSRCEDCFGDAEAYRRVKQAVADLRLAPDTDVIGRLNRLLVTLDERTA